MSEPIVIIGASVRAAAFSALRAGMTPWCVDLFADADVAARCEAVAVADYPHGLFAAADAIADAPWMYTGGLENFPTLVESLAERRLLLGNYGDSLRQVRDPVRLTRSLREAGFDVPEVTMSPDDLPRDGSWLVKRTDRSGGQHVQRWDRRHAVPIDSSHHYWQRFVAGVPMSAAYIMVKSRAVLLGVTRQLLGRTDGRDDEGFCYLGSLGPIVIDSTVDRTLTRLGQLLAEQFALVGLVGVDFVLDGDRVWPIEVNPRYTAGMELLERSGRFSAVAMHVAACADGGLPVSPSIMSGTFEKHILFASGSFTVDAWLISQLMELAGTTLNPPVADIPRAGTIIDPGSPVLTVLTEANDPRKHDVFALLQPYIATPL